MLTSRQIKLEQGRIRCEECHEVCKVYDIEPYANGKLARLKCPKCNWYSEGKVFLKEYNIPLQNRQRVKRIPEDIAIEKKENREERLQHYSPFLAESSMVTNHRGVLVEPNLPLPESLKEVRKKRNLLLKRKGLVHTTGKVEVRYY